MKTIRVVAAVIKAMNDNGEKIILPRNGDMASSKADGNFRVVRLNRERRHSRRYAVK